MRFVMLLLRLVLASAPLVIALPAAAQDSSPATRDIVVVGSSIEDSRRQLDACLARACPPDQDIAASLKLAESQFLTGQYLAARRTLEATRGRTARFDEQYPVEIGDLIRAIGRLTDTYGLPEKGLALQFRSLLALKAGLEDDDSRVLFQRLMIGDGFAKSGRPREAQNVYRAVAARASRKGKWQVQGHAMLREALMYGSYSTVQPMYRVSFADRLRQIEAVQAPEFEPYRTAAKLLRAKIAAMRGDFSTLDAAIATVEAQPGAPFLIHSPEIDPFVHAARGNHLNQAPEWIDVRFGIFPDGRVRDVEAVRHSGGREPLWVPLVLKSIAARRYAPLVVASGDVALVRVERCAYVRDIVGELGTGLKTRSTLGRFIWLDLTTDGKNGGA